MSDTSVPFGKMRLASAGKFKVKAAAAIRGREEEMTLVGRLRHVEPSYVGTLRNDGTVAYEVSQRKMLRNPDGPEAAERIEALEAALKFYANPEIYKPHPHGPAFERRDLSFTARAALNQSMEEKDG